MNIAHGTWLIRLLGLVLILSSAVEAHATIIGTNVDAGMLIQYQDSTGAYVTDATATDSGTTSASVSIAGGTTGATAYANLGFSALTAESATFNFDLGYNGGGYTGTGYLGQTSYGSNMATISYTATSDINMMVDWNFDYAGSDPFGLQVINLSGGPSETLGNYGVSGNFQGSTSYGLIAGNTYQFQIAFDPNVYGGIGSLDGSLLGAFNFKFSTVPEPPTLALLLFGLAGLGITRRKRS